MKDTDPGAKSIKGIINACWVIVLGASEKQMKYDVCFVLGETFLGISRQGFHRPGSFFGKWRSHLWGQGKSKKTLQDQDPCNLLQSKQQEGPPTVSFDKDSTVLNKS